MKTTNNHFLWSLLSVLCIVAAMPVAAQQERSDFFTVGGIVRDSRSSRPIANASVSVPDTRVGTVTNTDGSFSIKIKFDSGVSELEFSHLGYSARRLPIENRDRADLTVTLTPGTIEMAGITVVNKQARALVEEAIRRIGSNYSDRESMLTGFYRETVQKRNSYVDIAEAVVEAYRTPYDKGPEFDRVKIIKGRRLVSPRAGDTLAIKLQGGPNYYLLCDIIKNRKTLLNPESLDYYRFTLETPVVIDDRPHHTVAFEPGVVFTDEALFKGRLYIDRETLTISRAEYAYDMSNSAKVTSTILRRKPASLRFNPHEVSYILNYQRRDGRSYLYYIGVKIRFRCDWRRRLFATNYTISSETVITDGRDENVVQIPLRETFRTHQLLTDRVDDFYGPEFWEDYNIIEPTESLENAVDRLKRRIE